MSQLIVKDNDYAAWVTDIKQRFKSTQVKTSVKLNQEVLLFYWNLGRDMVNMNIEKRWGEGVMKMLSQDLKDALPEVNGFSVTNLYYIKRFYITYNQVFENLPQAEVNFNDESISEFLPQAGAKNERQRKHAFLNSVDSP